jgi:uncharacterized protein YqhQ
MGEKVSYGGMALIEGVMMRGPHRTALAVRQESGDIVVETEDNKVLPPHSVWRLPLVRGSYSLIGSMLVGMKALNRSANLSLEEEGEELSAKEMAFTIVVAVALAVGLFMVLPASLAYLAQRYLGGLVAQNVAEGLVRVIVFLIYIYSISRIKEIKRVLQYHGAEHKTIFAYEAGLPLTVENARLQPRLHPRCGTSFLLMVMVISIIVHVFLGDGSWWYRIGSRLLALPVVAGIAYEFIRFSGKCYRHAWARVLMAPGLYLQNLTTAEPDDTMLEVAIASLQAVLEENLEEKTAEAKTPEAENPEAPVESAETARPQRAAGE